MAKDPKDINALKARNEELETRLKQSKIEIHQILRDLKLARTKIDRDLEQAQAIQMGLLPQNLPKTAYFDSAAAYIPAAKVGGDYYDLFEVRKGCYCVLVADVSGHGIAAALIMSMAKVLIKAYANDRSPKETIDKVNQALNREIKNENFITMFYAILNFKEKKMRFSSAGHNPVILVDRGTTQIQSIKAEGIFLGVFDDAMVKDNTLGVHKNHRLVLYTDGLTEAENLSGEMYSVDRLADIIKKTVDLGPEAVKKEILQDLNNHIGKALVEDDITLLVLDINA
jgi:sigma-B regulation protein RsbU (phosphoserine phosphatase)